MNIDTGLAAVILAVLIFYLRLIILQRERAKRARQTLARLEKKTKKNKPPARLPISSYSILSNRRVDLAIAAAGIVAILVGVLLNVRIISSPAVQDYWWLPTALGIIAFSWAFKLTDRGR